MLDFKKPKEATPEADSELASIERAHEQLSRYEGERSRLRVECGASEARRKAHQQLHERMRSDPFAARSVSEEQFLRGDQMLHELLSREADAKDALASFEREHVDLEQLRANLDARREAWERDNALRSYRESFFAHMPEIQRAFLLIVELQRQRNEISRRCAMAVEPALPIGTHHDFERYFRFLRARCYPQYAESLPKDDPVRHLLDVADRAGLQAVSAPVIVWR